MYFKYFRIILFLFSFLVSSTSIGSSREPFVIIKNNWPSQIVFSEIVGNILKKNAIKIEYKTFGTEEQWGALARSVGHLQVEVWEGTMAKDIAPFITSKQIEIINTYKISTREEWWYPAYVANLCPGLPNWQALNKCYKLFLENENDLVGTYYAGPWEKPDEARIRALGLKFKVNELPSGEELTRKLLEAVENKRPIILFNWTPHWVENVIPGKFVEFPTYHQECEIDPKWGINKTFTHDCGNPKKGWLKMVVAPKIEEKWPCIRRFLSNIEMTNKDLATMAYDVERRNLSHTDAAQEWMRKNQSRWSKWVPMNCFLIKN